MNLHIARWGNSLAVRIPADYVRQAGLKEGDNLDAAITADGSLALRPAKWDRKAFMQEVVKARDAMPMGTSVIDELRRGARY